MRSSRSVALRRRSRPSLAARVKMYWIVLAGAALAAAWVSWILATLPAFRLQSLTVEGLRRTDRAQVVARAALDPNGNVWLIDTRAVERRIETIPYVLTASIHRSLPGRVRIGVIERQPEACVHFANNRRATVDAMLRVLALGCADAPPLAYELRSRAHVVRAGQFLADGELHRLQDDARTLYAAPQRYRSFARDEFGGLRAVDARGLLVLFGDDGDLPAKAQLVAPILARLGNRANQVAALDLRAPQTPVAVFRSTATHTLSTQYIQGTHRSDHNI